MKDNCQRKEDEGRNCTEQKRSEKRVIDGCVEMGLSELHNALSLVLVKEGGRKCTKFLAGWVSGIVQGCLLFGRMLQDAASSRWVLFSAGNFTDMNGMLYSVIEAQLAIVKQLGEMGRQHQMHLRGYAP